ECAKDDRVEDREERRVDADPNSKRHQRGDGITAILEQRAKAKSGIGHSVVEPLRAMGLARFFLDLREAAELDSGTSGRRGRIHAAADVAGDLVIEMESELLVELVVDRSTPENRSKAKQPAGEHAASSDYSISRISETAAVSFCQAEASGSSCAPALL